MNSDIFRVKAKDIIDGVLSAVICSVAVGLKGVFFDTHFSVLNADWHSIGSQVIIWAQAGFFGYVGNIFLSDKQGNVLGIGSVKE